MINKKIKALFGTMLLGSFVYAQQPPTTNSPGGGASGTNSQRFWSRGGNTNIFGQNNIFGTMWNSPIYTYTNGQQRMKINGTLSPTINGHTFNRSGYVGIGPSTPTNIFNSDTLGPYSLLHLNGGSGLLQVSGHHNWMRTGVTFTDNSDLSYFGLRDIGTENRNELVMVWSNNIDSQYGPDDMCFRFSNNGGSQNIDPNLLDNTDDDGLHIARFTGTGEFGLGPTFGVGGSYARPASLQHLSYVNLQNVFTQFTNRNSGIGTGTAETASDGFRIGLLGGPNGLRNGNALVYQQENRHLLFSTRANTELVTTDRTFERLRLTRVGAPTNLPNGQYGLYNPGNINQNRTRMSLSHNPNRPVTRPLSLFHLGYNTGGVGNGTTDGWRSWMDIGTFTSNGTDHMYFGLKREAGGIPGNDRTDAVINWGDNGGNNPFNGPDYLRFIFTETQTSTIAGDSIASSASGLEVVRVDPSDDLNNDSIVDHFGKFGIGNFVGDNVTHKLHVKGNGRFEYVPDRDSLTNYLLLGKNYDTTNTNDLELRKLALPNDSTLVLQGDGTWGPGLSLDSSAVFAHNAISRSTLIPGYIAFGQDVNEDQNPGKLLNDREVPMENQEILFTGEGSLRIGKMATPNSSDATVEIDNRSAQNDIGLLVNNQWNNSEANKKGVQVKMNLNTQDEETVGVDVEHTNSLSSPPSQNSWLFRARGLDFNNNSPTALDRLVSFGIKSYGHTGINLDNNQFRYGVMGISGYYSQKASTNPFTGQYRNRTLWVKNNLSSGQHTVGVESYCESPTNSATGVAGYSKALSTDDNGFFNGATGVYGYSQSTALNSPSIGVHGEATVTNSGTSSTYGVYGKASGSPNANYSIYGATASGSTNTPGNGNFISNYSGYFAGDVMIVGQTFGPSDEILKNNINNYENATEVINELKVKTFEYRQDEYPHLNLPNGTQFGLIAQDVEEVLPEIVTTNTHPAEKDSIGNIINPSISYKGVNYKTLIPILTKGMQEQNQLIEEMDSTIQEQENELASRDSLINDLNARLSNLENCLSNILPILCSMNQSMVQPTNDEMQERLANTLNIELQNKENIVLNQNVPNPFAENTTITYSVPASVKEAKIVFYDNYGKMIKEVEITERGNGRINVFGADLSKGMYSYTLIADGQVIATKKMMKQ